MKTLALATTGPLRQSMLSFLKSVPDLEILPGQTLQTASLVVLEMNGTPEQDRVVLQRLAGEMPAARFLVVAHSLRQLEAALAAGVDRALLIGFSATEFFEILQDLRGSLESTA